jgi:hypothetical protein
MILPILSWLIRLIEGTKFSHVYVRHDTKYGTGLVYQASGLAVNFMSEEIFLEKNEVVDEFNFDITDDAFSRYISFAIKTVGKSYGFKQLLGLFLVSVFGLKKNPFPSGRSDYVCSELVGDILMEIGKFSYSSELLDRLTPRDIYKFCLINFKRGAR